MTGIRISARTKRGQKAIENIIKADDGREDWQVFFTESLVSKMPLIIQIEHKSRVARKAVASWQMKEIVEKQLQRYAKKGKDFEVEAI